MNGEGYRDPTADKAIRNAGRLPRPIWNVVKAVREVLNVSHLELVEIRMRDRTTGREHKWGGDTNGEKGSGAVHRRMRADQRDGKDIRRLKKKRQTIVQTNVSGSNPDFPYNPQHFKIAGTAFTYEEDARLRHEEKILEERREQAHRLKVEVEQWMNHIPQRMQRIIKYRVFEDMSWSQVAAKLGRKATADSVRMEYLRFMEAA